MVAPFNSSSTCCSDATSPFLKMERSGQLVFSRSGVCVDMGVFVGDGAVVDVGWGGAVVVREAQEARSRLRLRKEAKSLFIGSFCWAETVCL